MVDNKIINKIDLSSIEGLVDKVCYNFYNNEIFLISKY